MDGSILTANAVRTAYMTTSNLDRASGFLGGLLNTLTERGRNLLGLSTSPAMSKAELISLGEWKGCEITVAEFLVNVFELAKVGGMIMPLQRLSNAFG